MIRKLFALLALVGLAAAPSTGWATTWVTTLSVAVNGEGGTVTVSNNGTQTSTSSSLTSSATHTYTITATANDTYSFVGWFTDGSDTPFSTAAQTTRDVKVTSSSYDSRTGSLTKGYTYTKSGGTLYAKFAQHTHKITYSINGDTITKSCTADGCPGGVGGTATLTANGATYDGKSHAASVAKTGDVSAELTYSCGSAPTAAGTYEVTMKVDGGTAENSTLTKSFTISPVSITAVTLNATSFNYDGTDKTTFIKSVKAGSLTPGAGDYDVSGDPMTQVGSLTEKKTYTVTVTGKGNYTGSASASWTINNPSGSFKDDALKPGAGCAANGNTVTVNDSAKLVYANGKWYASMTIELPNDQSKDGSYVQGATFVNAANTRVEYKGATYTGSQIQGGAVPELTAPAETPVDYKYGWIYEQRTYKYLPSVTYTMELTPEIITAALTEGKDALEGSVTVYALAWKDNQDVDGTFGCETGLKPTTYTLTVSIDKNNPKLFDENNQVYPELPYIANIGAKKYLTLTEALGAATEGQTVEVFDAAEANAFAVPMGVTVNLGANGATGSTYNLLVDDDHLGDAGAKIISTKAETVTTATGFGVKDDNFTYTLYRAHQHDWAYALNGATLTATCQATGCDVPGAAVAMSITATSNGDGQAPTLSYEGKDDFVMLTDATVGEITVTRPSWSQDNWYVGAYTASCVVTAGGQSYTLSQDFEILRPEGGYTSGFEAQGIGGYDVRFGTLLEAAGAANEGDTIFYRGGTLTGKEVTFSSSKNITLDLGGASLKRDAYETATLINSGAGTVTLTNGTIVQPKSSGALGSAGQMEIKGNFAFADITALNRATSGGNFFTMTVKSGTVTVLGGRYTAGFKADGGSVVYQGGKFWDGKYESWGSDHYQFSEPSPDMGDDTGYIVIPCSDSMDDGNGSSRALVWEVVAHTHNIVYTAAENVITAKCDAEHGDACGFGTQTLTLTAMNEKVSGQPYSSASIAYSDGFPVKDAVIEYWVKDGEQLGGAPSAVGLYEARVMVGGATAVAAFEITHIHEFVYDAVDAMNIGVKCKVVGGSCDYQEVKTVTLNAADTKTFDGAAYAVTFTKGEGFPSDDLVTVAIEYWVKNGDKLESAPSDVGSYTVKMIASEGGTAKYTLEKDFAIVQADLANATIELNKESYAFNGQAQVNGIKTIKIGNYTLVEGTDYTKSGDDFSQVGSPSADCTYTVTLTGIGNFTGTKELSWTITAPTGEMGKLEEVKGEGQTALAGELEGTTLTVTLPTNLCFLNGAWYAGLSVAVPNSIDGWSSDNSSGTNPDDLRIGFSHEDDLSNVDDDSYTWLISQKTINYAKSITWFAQFTLDEIEAAIGKGDTEIVRTMTVSAVPGTFNKDGIHEVVYTIKLPLEGLVLPVPAGATLDMAGTKFASEDEYEDYPYQLQLGAGAKVYGDPEVDDGYIYNEDGLTTTVEGYEVTCVEVEGAKEGECAYYFTALPINYNIDYSFVDEDGNTLTDVTNPYSGTKNYTVEDEVAFTEPATLDGYEFVAWSPAKIAKGTTGKQTITGTFRKSAIKIAIVQEDGITDVLMDGESVGGELELPADAKTVELTLVADGLTIPVYKVTTNGTTTVTSKTATYAIAAGDTLTFSAEEADETDPTVTDDQIKTALLESIDDPDPETREAAADKVESVVGEGANQVSARDLAAYINKNMITSADIADCGYVAASAKLDTAELIGEDTKVEIVEFVKAEGNAMTFEVKIGDNQVEVEAIKDMVEASSDLSAWAANRLEVDATFDEGKVTITPKGSPDKAFMRVVIPKDPE